MNAMGILDRLSRPNVRKLAEKRDTDGLIAALGHWSRTTRSTASVALLQMGAEAYTPLVRALANPDWRVRVGVIYVLAHSADRRAAKVLTLASRYEDARVRKAAVHALSLMGQAIE